MPNQHPNRPNRRPLVIGIAGGTGSGKTTIAESVSGNDPGILLIKQDAYYRNRPDLNYEQRAQVNYDHPDSLEIDLLAEHIKSLCEGQAVNMPEYDFTSHLRAPKSTHLTPAPVLIIEGILVLAQEVVRELLDLKIFIDTDADLRLMRRLERDINERGRTISSVLEQYARTVRPMHNEFVEPSKRYADMIIPGGYNPRVETLISALIRARITGHQVSESEADASAER